MVWHGSCCEKDNTILDGNGYGAEADSSMGDCISSGIGSRQRPNIFSYHPVGFGGDWNWHLLPEKPALSIIKMGSFPRYGVFYIRNPSDCPITARARTSSRFMYFA